MSDDLAPVPDHRPARVYVLYCDRHGPSGYFIRLGLGIFWECGPRTDAREFATRQAAATVLQRAGKHRHGWRVLRSDSIRQVRR